jgi:5-(aminomethyl)-3-furanmethanol phosphate kinase
MIVAKVGGSLFDWPGLKTRLNAWVAEQGQPVLLFPGGGPFADAVRAMDAVHSLGEERAHWLAIQSLTLAAEFLATITDNDVFDPYPFFRELAWGMPHSWAVTSDSLALRFAQETGAKELVLLKSLDVPPGTPWSVAAEYGWVDAYFPELAANTAVPVRIVNLRIS